MKSTLQHQVMKQARRIGKADKDRKQTKDDIKDLEEQIKALEKRVAALEN